MTKRILIVDDEDRVLFVLQQTLLSLRHGYEIVSAQSGMEALDQVKETPFDLLITDLRMPDMDGIRLTEAARRLDSDMAVIWITAYDCHRASADAERLSVFRCLDKPLEIGEIRRTVLEALEGTVDQISSVGESD
jgi:DNA-binding NtrC family response regulator